MRHQFYSGLKNLKSTGRSSALHRALLLVGLLAIAINNASAQTANNRSQPPATPSATAPATARSGSGGYLGVYLGDINEERARELKLPAVRGVIVGKVEEESPAAKARLQENDVIVAFNEQPVYNPAQFYRLLTEAEPDRAARLSIVRGGAPQIVTVVLGHRRSELLDERRRLFADADAQLTNADELLQQSLEARQKGDEKEAQRLFELQQAVRKESERQRGYIEEQLRDGKISLRSTRRPGYSANASRYQLGLRVAPLTEQLAKFFNVTGGGVLVTEVRAGEAAERAGLRAGDCIVAVGGARVGSVAELNRLVDRGPVPEPGELSLTIVRDRNEQTIKIKFE
jgi:S1-C subfamily serine protease